MGRVDIFEILFQKPVPMYSAGELVVGVVHIRVSERLKINSGRDKKQWATRIRGNFRRIRVIFEPDHIYHSSIGDQSIVSRSGRIKIINLPFQFQLPPALPTSFEHPFGRIRFIVYATLDIPWAFDKHSEKAFSVLTTYDLNMNMALRQPYGLTDTKVVCCGPCASDPITITFSIPKSGYVPGEQIFFTVRIDNKSKRVIKAIFVALNQQIFFQAINGAKDTFRNLARVVYPKQIPELSADQWVGSLAIPPVVSSANGTCRIIRVTYALILGMDASGAVEKDMVIPITIGTVPILPPQMAVAPQPTYQPCIFNRETTKMPSELPKGDVMNSNANTFKPIYPVFTGLPATNPANTAAPGSTPAAPATAPPPPTKS